MLAFTVDHTPYAPVGNAPLETAATQDTIAVAELLALTDISAGGPYSIDEGSPLTLSGSATGTEPLTYSWDVNGDGVFGDAAGSSPTLSWAQLVALGIDDGLTTRDVVVRVADNDGHELDSAASLLTVHNVAPSADAGEDYWVPIGSSLHLAGAATDPVDPVSYSWDVNGDGVFGDAIGANASLSWTQLKSLGITGPGVKSVRLRADDGDGGVTDSLPVFLVVHWGDDFSSTIVGRHIFYNQSVWDGNSALINPANDNAAIAPGKTAYLPGAGRATAANMTSYSRGINGIMVDLSPGRGNHAAITASDFTFKVGNNNAPNTWAAAPAPAAISVIRGGGVGGSDRLEITWASGAIKNQWLEVEVKVTVNTGLAAPDVFFWGNKAGDSATTSGANTFETTSTDAAQVFLNLGGGKPITNLRDYNRDGAVNSTDAANVFANIGNIVRLNVSVGGPFAPEGAPMAVAENGSRSAVAFALGRRGVGATPDTPSAVQSLTHPLSQDTAGQHTQSAVVASARHFEALTAASDAMDDHLFDFDDELCEPLLAALA